MKNFYFKTIFLSIFTILSIHSTFAQQVPNPSFEDWNGEKFDGQIQPTSWFASNVSQVGFNFNFANREAGHTGSYSMMVQDTEVGAMGITETSPGYFSLGKPWTYLEGLSTSTATAGTAGGMKFTYRPDTMSVWIKRTGNNTDKEDFYLLYYSWSGTAKGSKYKNKDGNCTSVSQTDEESDIRLALNKNECGTDQKANQIAEGMWRERKTYSNWTNIRVPIYYLNSNAPTMMNIIFSASNYPNFRANSGLYAGNSLYVDDIELIYSSKIQKIFLDGKEWKGFDPNSSEEQTFSLGKNATSIPIIKAYRGAGSLTNARGESANFTGRELSGTEITITHGSIDGEPTVIVVKAEDGSSTSTYKIKFVREASTNTKLANIFVDGNAINNFQPSVYNYTCELPYGTTAIPQVTANTQEEEQTIQITQATSTTGKATLVVTAADKKTTATYTVQFKIAQLADNTLQDIKVNGTSIPGFTPNQPLYRVSLPTSTNTIPSVEVISAYPEGEQTITHTPPTSVANLDGSQHIINVTTPGNPTPKTYRLTYKLEASSYSLLKDLQMGNNLITNFDPNQFTYYVNLPIGTTQMPPITFVKGESSQTVTVQDGGLNGVSKVIVVAGNGIDQSEYKIVVTTAKSEISTLNMIYIGGDSLAGFVPNKLSYTYSLPVGTTQLPAITVDKGDESQKVNITTGGINGTTRIAVTAENGSSTIYQIAFSVNRATNASLKMIYLDGVPLSGFDPNILDYSCPLPQGTTTLPVITYDQADPYQTITVRSGGVNGDYRITVRPQSGASQTYVLHFSVATSNNVSLKMIYLDGIALNGFHPDTLNYIDTLPVGVYTIPTITYDKGEASQKILSICSQNVQTIQVTAESGKTQTYTITFIIQRSNSAYLKMIYLDGDSLIGFNPNTFEYNVSLTTTNCPKITVDKEEGQQVTITTPHSTGQAKIVVTPLGGASNTYLINFIDTKKNTALLKNIYVDGVAVAGFSPDIFDYKVTSSSINPIITYDADSTQNVKIFRQNNIVTLYVMSGGYSAQYQLTICTLTKTDCTLSGITVDGTTITNFNPNQYLYTIAIGKNLPVIGYIKQHAEQTVYAGMQDADTYSLLVRAESGDTARYNIEMQRILSDDANLINLTVTGLTINFQPTTYIYTLDLPAGYTLPDIQIVSKEGQNTAMHIVSAVEQHVVVTAENGKQNTYRILYNRNTSSNAYLSDILVDGKSLKDFESTTFHYSDTLALGTEIVPCIQPIGMHEEQTITTYHGTVDGITKIVVLAADGITQQEYTIAFPVLKSSKTHLKMLEIADAINYIFDPNQTTYQILLPYGTSEVPQIFYEKAETAQDVTYISAPIDGTTQLIVTAENGEQRTYSLTFTVQQATSANTLKTIIVNGNHLYLDKGNTFEVVLPYGSDQFDVLYEKNFAEQTVSMVQQGVHQPTLLTVYSNRAGEKPTTYTIIPKVTQYNPATLNTLLVNGTPINGFKPDQYSYIVNIDEVPEITYTHNDDVTVVEVASDSKHIVYQVTSGEYSNTYTIYYYYQNDVIPGKNFTETTTTTYNGKAKPAGWMVPADCAESYTWTFLKVTTGQEVTPLGNNTVHLSTWRDGDANAIYGSIPGIMTIGTLNLTLASTGNSTSSVSGGITFRNTPDQIATDYRTTAYYKMDNWRLWVELSDGTNTVQTLHKGSHEPVGQEWQSMIKDLDYTGLGLVTKMNLTVNSAHSDNAKDLGGSTKRTAEMDIRNLRFIYNSKLASVTVDGNEATITGNTITYNINDAEYCKFPEVAFVGEKADQMPVVTWENEVNGIRTAQVRNYGEDGSYTDYQLQITRTLSTEKQVQNILINGTNLSRFDGSTLEYTDTLPNGYTTLPNVSVIAKSAYQQISIQYINQEAIINVVAENGDVNTYTIHFVESRSNSTKLASIVAEGITFDPEVREYHITDYTLPEITFTKLSDGQTVTLDRGILTVQAEDGTIGIYKIILDAPSTTGQLSMIEIDGVGLQGFSSTTYDYMIDKPNTVLFKRMSDRDSVVYIQTPLYMEWQVYGTEQHTYRITYPNNLSSDTSMDSIIINGELIDGFNKQIYDYIYKTDETVHIKAVANTTSASMESQQITKGDTLIYTYTITAENGTKGQPYSVMVVPNLSSTAHLDGIYLDGKMVSGFHKDSLRYTITLPVGTYKEIEPTVPSITYQLGASRQHVTVEHGTLGEVTTLFVLSEDGTNSNTYELFIEAEASHCVSLTGIAVNGQPIDRFTSNRHYYSVKCNDNNVTLTWSSNDRFQTITETNYNNTEYTLHVRAQDGISTSDYIVEIYQDYVSADVTLAGILLDGQTFDLFEPSINTGLLFSPMQQRYNINLPSGTQYLPEVTALLNSEGQKVDITLNNWDVLITVTAPDGISTNTYSLHFSAPKSNNSLLKMIYLDGDTLNNFKPTTYKYDILLPMGQTTLPKIYAEPQETTQTVVDSITGSMQHTIFVTAENGTQSQYHLSFIDNPSQADTLLAIYGDGVLISGFRPDSFYYAYTLPIGTTYFPTLTWDAADIWQNINASQIVNQQNKQITQIQVVAGSGRKNVYTVEYNIAQSSIDTLEMIYIQGDSLVGFHADTLDYHIDMNPGDTLLPSINWKEGEMYQMVTPISQPLTRNNEQIGWKTSLEVLAQDGHNKIYTLYFYFSKPLSTNTDLINIYLDGKPLKNFMPSQYIYRDTVAEEKTMPAIFVEKAEQNQTVRIDTVGGNATIAVLAEDTTYQATYTIYFTYLKSSYAYLEGIYQDGIMIESFRVDSFDYQIDLPYGTTTLPTLTYQIGKVGQIVTIDTLVLNDNNTVYQFTVIAPDQITSTIYTVRVNIAKNNNSHLKTLMIKGIEIANFHADTLNYIINHPIGSDSTILIQIEDVQAIAEDSLATVTITQNDTYILIEVVAADGNSTSVYSIEQFIEKSEINRLSAIYVVEGSDTLLLRDFDPEVTEYVYFVPDGMTRTIIPIAEDSTAIIEEGGFPSVDTAPLEIQVTAQDGSEKKYYIYFVSSTISESATPNALDVLMKHVKGTKDIVFATIRTNVYVGVYTIDGQMLFYEDVPASSQNDIIMINNADGHEELVDVYTPKRTFTLPEENKIYFYVFFENGVRKIDSGKVFFYQ